MTASSLDNLKILLYGAVIIELLFFIGSGYLRIGLMMIALTSFAALIRVRIGRKPPVADTEWFDVKSKLNRVLIENKIIEKAPFQTLSHLSEGKFIDQQQTTSLHELFSPSVIEELRLLGLDGILICLYLLKNRNSFHSIKAIQEHLFIPRATVYRNIQKLLDLEYVDPKSQFDNPAKSYYKISYEGEVLMFDFYDLLNVQDSVQSLGYPVQQKNIDATPQQITKLQVNHCKTCGAIADNSSPFCGECGEKL